MKYEYEFEDRWAARMRRECHFGIISGAIAAAALWAGAGAATAATAGTIGAGVVVGAGLGAGEAAAMGGDPGMGALGGAISGGVLSGAGPVLGGVLSDAGMGAGAMTTGDVLAGAAGGTLSAAATGGDLAQGAAGGAASGLIQAGMEGNLSADVAPSPAVPVAPGPGGYTGAAPVESVTVTGAAPPAGINLAGVPTGAKTAEGKTQPGVETATVTGIRTPTSPLTPTAAGAVQGGNLNAATPTAQLGAAQTSGQMGTSKNTGIVSPALPTESVTVTGNGSLAPSATHAGVIAPTGAGILASTGPEDADVEKKKYEQQAGDDQSFLDKLGTKTEDALTNPYALVGGAALLADATGLFHGGNAAGNIAGGTAANAQQLQNIAADDATQAARLQALGNQNILQGQDLQKYLQTGTLPPGMQAQIDAAKSAAKASTHQMYANMGMGGGNTSMFQDLANIDMEAAATSAKLGQQLYETGQATQTLGLNMFQQALANTNAGSAIYSEFIKTNMQQDQNLSQGVNNFVTALANMSKASSNAVTSGAA